MKKEFVMENRGRVRFALISLLVISLLWLGFGLGRDWIMQKNDRAAGTVLDSLRYTEDTAEAEILLLQRQAGARLLSTEVRGQLYRAMTEVSYMLGDDMLYNQYFAAARYYLERADDVDSIIYLTNKYIGRLYANGCYASAQEVLNELAELRAPEEFAPQMRADYYLSCADVKEMLGENPQELLTLAEPAIEGIADVSERSLRQAKLDILRARAQIAAGDFDAAAAYMQGYSETDDFGLGANQVYLVCDYQIPYYEITARLALHEGDMAAADAAIEKYIAGCDAYQFRRMKLNLLEYAVQHCDATAEAYDRYVQLEKRALQDNLDEMTGEYGEFLLSDIDLSLEKLTDQRQRQLDSGRAAVFGSIGLYVLILLYCVGSGFMNSMNRDGLTRLNNRRRYEQIRMLCERRKQPYCLLMIDIDDFKRVNDSFGHDKGDVVLRTIADIVRRFDGRGISSYRYGGEEMCMVFMDVPEKRCREIAEEIRAAVAQSDCLGAARVTISGGIGVSVAGENVFQTADQNLYVAKRSGKNQIR